MISVLHPSRGRPEKSFEVINKWLKNSETEMQVIVAVDYSDPRMEEYIKIYRPLDEKYGDLFEVLVNPNESAVQAINRAAQASSGGVLMVVSDDTHCFQGWDSAILKEVEGKTDFILKTQDGIQPWIITNPILDRAYYNRTGYIYDPDFKHMFCDTWLTVQADISGRKLTSNLMFRHLNDTIKDDVRKRSDATWDEGQRTFIHKLKQTPVEDLRKITDQSMKNWIRTHAGIRL